MTKRQLAVGLFLVALVVSGCTPSRTAVVSPSPTAAMPSPATGVVSPSPSAVPSMTATPIPTSLLPTPVLPLVDTRLGACFFGPQLNVTDLPCADLLKTGIRSTFFGVWWGQIEPQPGQFDWSWVDGPVDAAVACGIAPTVKVTTASGPGQDGTMPEDLEAYARFISALAQHLKGRVHAYAIENEVNNGRMTWTGETYGALRAAAYRAIKSVDAEAMVLDSGLTMQAYLAARANDLVQAGRTEEAIAMLQRFGASMTRSQKNLPATERALTRWLSNSTYQRGLGLMDELRQNPDTFDAVQLHYLQDAWELIPEYVSWVREWFPGKPFEFWEIGYGWDGEEAGEPFSEQGHAAGVAITLVSVLGEGASRVIYEPYLEEIKAGAGEQASRKFGRGLVTSDAPRLAAAAYGTMASQLGGYEQAERLDLGAEVWAYRFVRPDGDVFVIWSKDNANVRLPITAAQVIATDITGASEYADPAAIRVGTSPIFIAVP